MTNAIGTNLTTGDKVEFDDGYQGRPTGAITEAVGNGKVIIRYGAYDRSLAMFDIIKDNVHLVCQFCGQAGPNVAIDEDPYEADVNNNPGVRVAVCGGCLQDRWDDI